MPIIAPFTPFPQDDGSHVLVALSSEDVIALLATISECQSCQEAITLGEARADARQRLAAAQETLRMQVRRIPGLTQEQKAQSLVIAAENIGSLSDAMRLTIWRVLVPSDKEWANDQNWGGR